MTAAPVRPPLEGITVLEVGTFIAAPFATMQLADLGARVVKIENPTDGDSVRNVGPFLAGEGSAFLRINRNKEALALDLKSAKGIALFLQLVADADVLIENMRPGTMTGLGAGYEEVRKVNPGLIYASASGWGQTGPLAHLAGLDIMAQARSGLMSVNGSPGAGPAKVGVPICDLVCALYLALAVTAALHERTVTGLGQRLDVSLFEAGVSLGVWEAAKYFATGEHGGPMGSAHQSLAPYQAMRTRDGFLTVGAVTPKTWKSLCSVLGLDELLTDPRFTDASTRFAHRENLIPVIEQATASRLTDELVAELEAAGVPCSPINNYSKVFNDKHLNSRNYFWDAPHPELGTVRQLGSPMHFSRTPVRQGSAAPKLGGDTLAVLRSAGIDDAQIADLVREGIVVQAKEFDQ